MPINRKKEWTTKFTFEGLKVAIIKKHVIEVKKKMMTMSHQIKNVNRYDK